jgi:hypothetical protein
MSTRLAIAIVILCLIGFDVWGLIRLRKAKSTLNTSYNMNQSISDEYKNYIHRMDSVLLFLMESEISKERLLTALKDNVDIMNELGSGPKLIVHYKEGTCSSCVIKCFLDLEIVAEKIGRENIIVTTNWQKDGHLMKNSQFDFKQYFVDTYRMPIEKVDSPIAFILSPDLNVSLLYATEIFPDIRSEYFFRLVPMYFHW